MGLWCSHGAWEGSYMAFNQLRKIVCEAAGGTWGPMRHDQAFIVWHMDAEYLSTREGLREFLSHDDDRGSILPAMCRKVARDLEELLPKVMSVSDNYGGRIAWNGGYGATLEKFIAGCRLAAKERRRLRFR